MNNLFQNGGKTKNSSRKKEYFLDTVEKKSVKKGRNSKTSIDPSPKPDNRDTGWGWKLYQKTERNMKTNVKSKKGGNFLETIGEFVAPTGWEGFATAAGLLALDRADAALRRGKKTSKKMKGGDRGNNEQKPSKHLLPNRIFQESREPEKDYLEIFIQKYIIPQKIIDTYGLKSLSLYFKKLKKDQDKLQAKEKLQGFLNKYTIEQSNKLAINNILKDIQL